MASFVASSSIQQQDISASLPDLDHLTIHDLRDIYEPSDDTFLLMDAIEADAEHHRLHPPRLCVEIGAGAGCVTAVMARTITKVLGDDHSTLFLATDINPKATKATRDTGKANKVKLLEVIEADLLGPMQERLKGQIDVVVFNPPYVPTPSEEIGTCGIEAAWAGGIDGREVIDRLLPDIPALLSPKGMMYLVVVQDNRPKEMLTMMQTAGLQAKVLRTRKARNEVLSILKFYR